MRWFPAFILDLGYRVIARVRHRIWGHADECDLPSPEHRARFLAPVRAGDTLTTAWTIRELQDKPKHRAGVVVVTARATIQTGDVVAEAEARMLVERRPA